MKLAAAVVSFSAVASAASLFSRGAPVACSTCPSGARLCHPSASCVFHGGLDAPNQHYCTCPPGFKANPREVGADPAAQWRLPWAGHENQVFVRWETACGTPCNTPSCEEIYVNTNPQCFK